MEAEGQRGTQCANSRTLIAQSLLTCMCEGTERASQGQDEQQLNVHHGENFSPPVTTFRDSLGAKSTTPEPSHTPETHQPASPEGKGEGPKKVKNENEVFRGSLGKVAVFRSLFFF